MTGNELRELIRGSGMGLRAFCRKIERDPANVSRMCSGKLPVSSYVEEQARLLRSDVIREIKERMDLLERAEANA